MIDSRELRQNNWVLNPDGCPLQLTAEELAFILTNEFQQLGCDPIAISPDILEKCGFEKIGMRYPTATTWRFISKGTTYHIEINTKYEIDNPNCGYIGVFDNYDDATDVDGQLLFTPQETLTNFAWGIKYLHQLQNLFYCLTNTELTITL